jgi:uncharacterized membrane protein YhaH (DUF805 family)
MIDPFQILYVTFGGALIGLIAGFVRKRGVLGTILGAAVAGVCGIAASVAAGRLLNPDLPGALLLLYLTPVIGGLIGVALFGMFRREAWFTIGELSKILVVFVPSLFLLFVAFLVGVGVFFFINGSSQYTSPYLRSPATLSAEAMAGSDKVTVKLQAPLTQDGELRTATATEIFAQVRDPRPLGIPTNRQIDQSDKQPEGLVVGRLYRLRIINSSPDGFAWTLVAGTGVTLEGSMTITERSWHDFRVTLASPSTVLITSTGNGSCQSGLNRWRCSLYF